MEEKEKGIDANAVPYFSCRIPAGSIPVEKEILVRNSFTWVVLILVAVNRLNLGFWWFVRPLINGTAGGRSILMSVSGIVLALLSGAFYLLLAFKKDYLLPDYFIVHVVQIS